METSEKSSESKKTLTVDEVNIEILPIIYEIIRRYVVTSYKMSIFIDLCEINN